jgi:ABC-type nitrate/sulfonate/bicarbonate transport system ATPase subunit
MKIISLKDLTFSYFVDDEKKEILKSINLTILDNEIVSIVGPSGCGKTTLLKLIGDIFSSRNFDLKGKIERKDNLKVGYISQKARLLPWLTLMENIELVLKITREDSKNVREEINEYLKETNLYEFRDYYPFQLSGGMKTRAILIRSFVYYPDLMILDEPFNDLDELTRYKIYDLLLEYWQKNNLSVIIVTHNIREAFYLSDRIIVLEDNPSKIVENIVVDTKKFRGKRNNIKVGEYEEYIWKIFENGSEKRA